MLPTAHQRPCTVRTAAQPDLGIVAAILGEAFRDDPVLSWIAPAAELRHHEVPRYFRVVTQHLYGPHHHVYLTDCAAGAALWLPPGVAADSLRVLALFPLLGRLYWTAGAAALRRAHLVAAALRSQHPAQPHYYLHAVGVRSGWQGHGIGSALIQQVTERCDREDRLAYLENSNARNLPLYERNGFQVVRAWQAPAGGPTIWFMLRRPHAAVHHSTAGT